MSFSLNHRTSADTGREALRSAFQNNTVIALAILNGASDTVGVKGLWGDFKVAKFTENQPEGDHVTYDVEVVPYDSGVDPEWVEVAAA